ncbi:MAG TPA: hypothetical protein VEQ40_03980, partial [Pyrinomonadaceae bacterium]|nr:hypothetical protein [Pyrinomonadaceae bacterium]
MGNDDAKAVVHVVGDDLFIGITPSGHAQVIDTNHERAASPVELLLIALGSCTAVDVVSIMR